MELQVINSHLPTKQDLPFIEANTIEMPLQELKDHHIIPVFNRDNTPLISQSQFIETTHDVVQSINTMNLQGPFIRVSHPVKGRIPSARHKKALELLPHEETLYYERMMFCYLVPGTTHVIDEKELKLVIGGIKAYNKDNLNKFSQQHFQFFIGFQVKVCSNLCVWSDGVGLGIKTDSLDVLGNTIRQILLEYDPEEQLRLLKQYANVRVDEQQFAHLVGKIRMHSHYRKTSIPFCGLNDSQVNSVVKGYCFDAHFKGQDGIDLWSLYNLFTDANKSSYIDSFVERGMDCQKFIHGLYKDIQVGNSNWYLST